MNAGTSPDRLRLSAILKGGIALISLGVGLTLHSLVTQSGPTSFAVGLLAWMLAGYNGSFHSHIARGDLSVLPVTVLASMFASLGAVALAAFSTLFELSAVEAMVLGGTISVSLLLGIACGRLLLRGVWRRGEFRSTAIVAGCGTVTAELALELSHYSDLGIDLVETIDLDVEGAAVVVEAVRLHRPDRLVLGALPAGEEVVLPALRLAGVIGTRVYVLPRMFSMGGGNPLFSPDRLRGFPLQRVNRPAHPHLALGIKRAMDVSISISVLLVLLPFLIAVAVLVKVGSPGPLLFWQERLGRDGELIRIPKFRSMRPSTTSDFEWTAEERITRIGHVLRRTALDEVPQLWSVLKGDMSLVGPRPERPSFASEFALAHAEYDSRHRMRAGLTGLAQIAGLRGDTSIRERAKYDNLYIDQWSLSGDLVILVRTVGAVLGERRRTQDHREFERALTNLDLTISTSSPSAPMNAWATGTAALTESRIPLGAIERPGSHV